MATEELLKELLGQGKKKDFDPLQYFRIIWRKKFLLLAPLALAWGIAAIGVGHIPATYMAASSVAIESSTNFTRDLTLLLDEQAGHRQDVSELARVRAELRNQEFLNGVIDALRLDQTAIIREKATRLTESELSGEDYEDVVRRLVGEEIRRRTEVRFGSSGVYNIRTESADPGNAYLLNRVMTQKYVEMRRQRELAEVTAKGDFSDEQVAIYKEKLNRAELELERFQATQQEAMTTGNPVSGQNVALAEETMNTYREELHSIESQVGNIRTQLRERFGVVPTSDRLLSDRDLRAVTNKQISTMLQNLIQYLRGLSRADVSLTDHVEDASVGIDRQAYRDRLEILVDQVYGGNSPGDRQLIVGYYYRLMLLSSFQEIVDSLNRYVQNFRENVSGQPALQAEEDRRQAEVDKYKEFLDAFQRQSTSAQINRAIQASQLATRIEIRDYAVRPIKPIRPNRTGLQIAFVVVGLLTGIVIIFLTEFLNRSFNDIKEIEETLGVPVLGTIPPLEQGPGKARIQRRKNTLMWVLAMLLFALVLSGGMMFLKNMNSRVELFIDREAAEEIVP